MNPTNRNNLVDGEVLDEDRLKSLFAHSVDVVLRELPPKGQNPISGLVLYCEGMIDGQLLNQHALPNLERLIDESEQWDELVVAMEQSMEWKKLDKRSEVETLLFAGHLIAFFALQGCFFSMDISQLPQRQPEESSTEISIKGARDAFTEDINTNVALIRKRLPTCSLHNERYVIGTRSSTKISLLYISDIIQPQIIDEARNRLKRIEVDALIASNQLEEALSDSSLSIFPLLDYIGRPDFASTCLLRGRFIILVDGSPMALIAPCNLLELLKTPEDAYFPYYFVIFERMLRLLGLFIAIFLPGFWIALTSYDLDQIPFPLLATITTSRFGLPFSTPMELLLMLAMFELFREAGIRLPKAVGQTIAVLGGLIIGDAAIRAGMTSPTMLVVSATTAVATFTLVNQTLTGTVSLIRIYVLLWASILGMFGFFIGMMSLLAYLSVLKSFGLPYLSPVSPLVWKDVVAGLLAKPWSFYKKRPSMLNTVDTTRQGRDNE